MSSTNRGAARSPRDAYYTPRWAIELIAREVDWLNVTDVLDPACGDGRISHTCQEGRDLAAHTVWTEWDIDRGQDYFECRMVDTPLMPSKYDLGITNPPFSHALDFARCMLDDCYSVVLLQRLNWMGTRDRLAFWQANPPTHVFVIGFPRPQFELPDGSLVKGKDGKPGTDSIEYAWFGWDRREAGALVERSVFKRPPGVHVLDGRTAGA